MCLSLHPKSEKIEIRNKKANERGVTMRSLILSTVLGFGAFGLLGALPTEAKAAPPRTAQMQMFSVGPYSTMTAYGNPYLSYYSRPYGAGITYGSPAMWRGYQNPVGFGASYVSPGAISYNYSAYGLGYYLSTPSYAGYSYSPYTGLRSYYVPGTTVSVPYDTSSYSGGYYNNYVPSNYILRP